jgi:hypothetical protein
MSSVPQAAKFERQNLLAMDFDGTIARTFEPSPGLVDVISAYNYAVGEVFGTQALRRYLNSGGLHNRAPSEVVRQLSEESDEAAVNDLTSRLVEAKLAVLLKEIGERDASGNVWPALTDGFLQLQSWIAETGNTDQIIISSGHHGFIAKTLEVHGLPEPNVGIIAEEYLRNFYHDHPAHELVKPSPLLFEIALERWANYWGCQTGEDDKKRVIYAGDDPVKDGGLAFLSHVGYVQINPEESETGWSQVQQELQIRQGAVA